MVRAGGASISAARCLFRLRSHSAPKMIAASPAMISTIKPMLHGSTCSACHTVVPEGSECRSATAVSVGNRAPPQRGLSADPLQLRATTTAGDSRCSRRHLQEEMTTHAFPFPSAPRRRRQPSEHRSKRSEQSSTARCASSWEKMGRCRTNHGWTVRSARLSSAESSTTCPGTASRSRA